MINKKKLAALGAAVLVVIAALVVALVWAITSGRNTTTEPATPAATRHPTSAAGQPSAAPSSSETPGPVMDSNGPMPSEPPISTTDPRTPIAKPGKSGTPRGLKIAINKVDRTDPDTVAVTFATLCGTYDTKIDRSPNDAGRRAATLATPTLAASMSKSTGVTGPDAAWTTMAAHHAYTTVQVQQGGMGEGPKDSTTQAARAITIVLQQHGDHGWRPAPDAPATLLIWLQRSGGDQPWSVSKYLYR